MERPSLRPHATELPQASLKRSCASSGLAPAAHPAGPAHRSINLDCVELSEPSQALLRGPWSLRNLHPTTRLLHWLPAAPGTGGGGAGPSSSGSSGGGGSSSGGELLVFSSRSVLAVATGGGSGGGSSGGAAKREVVHWQLDGLPSAVAVAGGGGRRLIVGDDAGGEGAGGAAWEGRGT
jgi:hypothetical protein